jgi:hypothetical protein
MTSIAPARKAGRLQGIVLLLPVTLAVMGVIVLVPVVPQMMAHFSGLVTTWLAQRVGGLTSAFVVLGVLSMIAACLAALLHLRLRGPERAASYS